eukprot:9476599-Pyramimonas_sp.AAC.1
MARIPKISFLGGVKKQPSAVEALPKSSEVLSSSPRPERLPPSRSFDIPDRAEAGAATPAPGLPAPPSWAPL